MGIIDSAKGEPFQSSHIYPGQVFAFCRKFIIIFFKGQSALKDTSRRRLQSRAGQITNFAATVSTNDSRLMPHISLRYPTWLLAVVDPERPPENLSKPTAD